MFLDYLYCREKKFGHVWNINASTKKAVLV